MKKASPVFFPAGGRKTNQKKEVKKQKKISIKLVQRSHVGNHCCLVHHVRIRAASRSRLECLRINSSMTTLIIISMALEIDVTHTFPDFFLG